MDAVPAAILIARDSECRELVGNRTAYEIMPWRFTDTSFLSREKSPDSVKLHKDGAEIGTDQLPVRIAARTLRPVIHYEFEVEHDKTQQCLLGNAVPLLDESGRGRGAVGAFIDITESRRMQERLREAQKLESIGLLAGGIAHDFNNLLVPILGSASLARERVAKNHPVVPLLEDIEGAAERAAHLTRQMLAYAGKAQFMLERVDVSAAIREAISLVRVSIPHGIAVALDLAAGLPAVEADAREIQQILMNVLMNAVEAIETQSGSISIRTELVSIDDAQPFDFIGTGEMSPGRYVGIRISDTGCGMDEATRTRIFDPFFSTKFAGRGLGLAAVAGIIRAHRGGLRVTSAPGKGATFEILLRAASGPEPRCEVSPPEEHVAVNASASVLVVDDEQVVLRMAKLSLEREGYHVYVAESGPAAIHLFKSEARDIDLVVLDLSMPGMNGEETLAALQGIDPNVKAVISSGYSKVEALRTFGSRRTFGFVQKPYRPSQLVAAVKTALAEVQQSQAT
jgi:signal transduction histidine kinase/ActR/RegA family two-component response regulator